MTESHAITVHSFGSPVLSLGDLIQSRSVDPELCELAIMGVEGGRNVLVSGGTGSGKTTFMQALAGMLDPRELVRAALRHRPDRIFLGEWPRARPACARSPAAEARLDGLYAIRTSLPELAVRERSGGAAALAAMELTSGRRAALSALPSRRHGALWQDARIASLQLPWGKTFHALSGTVLIGLHHKHRQLALGRPFVARESVRQSAQHCRVAVTKAFRWRHRFLEQA